MPNIELRDRIYNVSKKITFSHNVDYNTYVNCNVLFDNSCRIFTLYTGMYEKGQRKEMVFSKPALSKFQLYDYDEMSISIGVLPHKISIKVNEHSCVPVTNAEYKAEFKFMRKIKTYKIIQIFEFINNNYSCADEIYIHDYDFNFIDEENSYCFECGIKLNIKNTNKCWACEHGI